MKRNIVIVFGILVIASLAQAAVKPGPFSGKGLLGYEQAEWEVQLQVNTASFSLKDPGDSVYIGAITKSGWGFGPHLFVMFPIDEKTSWGPNLNFNYGQINNNEWYSFETYRLSVGPALKYYWDDHPFYLFANYDFGFLTTEEESHAAIIGGTAPAGRFASNIRGYVFGLRGQLADLSNNITIGPYFTYSLVSFMAFKYKSVTSNGYTFHWGIIDTTFLELGASVTF